MSLVEFVFTELDQLVIEYQKHRAALEETEQARKATQSSGASAGDDFDPFP